MDEKDFKTRFIIVTSVVLILLAGVIFFIVQSKRVDSVVAMQNQEINTLENRKAVLKAGNSTGTGGKSSVVGLDADRVKRDTEALEKMLDEISSLGGDAKKIDAFKEKYSVAPASEFQISVLPDGKKSPVDGLSLQPDVYCSGISGAIYKYVVIAKVDGKVVVTLSADTSDNAKTGEVKITNIGLMQLVK